MTIEELKVIITAETAGLQKELDGVKNQLGGLNKSTTKATSGMASAFKKLGKGFAAGAIIAGMAKVGKQAINLASDLQEVQNVVDVAFGSASEEINKFAANATKQFGLSEYAAKKAASTFMSMANGLGLAADDGKLMSVQLTGLSADMASFYNVSQDVAQTALNGVFTGETEALKKFGVVMTQANLEAFAMSRGIEKSYQSMSEAEKVALRYNFVLNATKNAQGDFERTSGGWANQVRLLKENFNSLLTILGKGLVQVLTPVVQMLNKLLGYLIAIGNHIAKIFGGKGIKDTSTSIQDTAAGAGDLSAGMGDANEELDGANKNAKKLQKTLGSFDELNVMADNSSSGSDAASADAGAAGGLNLDTYFDSTEVEEDGFGGKIEAMFDKMKAALEKLAPIWQAFTTNLQIDGVIDKLKTKIGEAITRIQEFGATLDFSKYIPALTEFAGAVGQYMSTLLNGIVDITSMVIGDLFNAMAPAMTEYINNTIPTFINIYTSAIQVANTLLEEVITIFTMAWNTIKPALDLLGQMFLDLQVLFNSFWNEYGKPITEGLIQAIQNISGNIQTLWNSTISPVISNLISVLGKLWNSHLQPLFKKLFDFIGKLVTAVLELWNNVLSPLINWIIQTIAPTVTKVVNTVVNTLGVLLAGVLDTVGFILDSLGGLIDFIVGVFTGDWERAWNGIKDFFEGIWNAIVTILKTVWDTIVTLIGGALDAIWTAITTIFSTLADWISTLWNGLVTALTSLFNTFWNWIKNTLDGLIKTVKGWIESLAKFLKDTFNTIKSTFESIMNAIKNIVSTVTTAIKNFFSSMADGVKTIVNNLKTSVVNVFNGIKDTLSTVVTNIKTKVTNGFNSMKTAVVGVFNGIKDAIKTPINGIIGFINGLVSGVVKGINGMIDAMNKLSFDVPDWVPGIGGKKFGFNIAKISAPQIPLLANGGVITSPTVAMMGEYPGAKNNPEIVTPQNILRETIAESNEDLIDTLVQLNRQLIGAITGIDMSVQIGDDVIASSVQRSDEAYFIKTGKHLITV